MADRTEKPFARLCRSLRSARERLCVAQTDVAHKQHRDELQDALDTIDRLGVFYCPDWSRFDVPDRDEEASGG